MFGFIAEIVGLTPLDPSVQPRTSPSKPSSSLVDAVIPPPPPGCCPKCRFKGEPASFLRSYADTVSSSVVRRGKEVNDLGITLDHTEQLEVHRRGLSFENRRMNQESLGCVSCP